MFKYRPLLLLSFTIQLFVAVSVIFATQGKCANDSMFPPDTAAQSFINFDGQGFLINGQRTWIISGSLHYPRVPREQWRDRLLRMKRAGLNCVETYAFWNFHEPHEGQWDFSGNRDIDAFLKLVKSLNMYAIVRVGPYVCAEVDSGGYPVWLKFKPGVQVREDNPRFEQYTDAWLNKIMPIVVANEINHGGSVILVQLENEDPQDWGTDVVNPFFKNLQVTALANGLDVPYFFSGMHHGDPGNRPWDSVGRTSPWFSTEYYPGWFSLDGAVNNPLDRSHDAWKILSLGGTGNNYYMFVGSSSFDYTNDDEDGAEYDYGAPIGQAGDIRPDYYLLKRAALFGRAFAPILEQSTNATDSYQGVVTGSSVSVTSRTSPNGSIVFLDNTGNPGNTTEVKDPAGNIYPAAGPIVLDNAEIVPIVENFFLTPHIKIAIAVTRIANIVDEDGVGPSQVALTIETEASRLVTNYSAAIPRD